MRRRWLAVLALAVMAACAKEEAKQKIENVQKKVEDKLDDIAAPVGPPEDPKAREQERFDEGWRGLESFRPGVSTTPQGPAAPEVNVQFVHDVKESFKGLNADLINNAPVSVPIKGDVAGPSVLKTQVYLDRVHFSVGALDGRWGRNSAIAVWWYQRTHGLESTGAVDEGTFRALAAAAGAPPAVVAHTLTADDVKGPFVSIPEDIYEKEKLDCLCYESLPEKLAERFHTTQEFLERLNPDVKLSELAEGQSIVIPNVREQMSTDQPDIARIVVSIRGNTFNGYDANGNVVFHAPTTVGSKYDPSPKDTTTVKSIVQDPHFHYQPTLFHEVPDSDPEAHLSPGPNSPVGVVWIALSKPHFGIHGTSDPDSIGYASSHGCVRLANWDAEEVSHRVAPGVPVEFVDTRTKS